MGEVVKLERVKVGRSTLAEIYEEITEGIFPFVTFRVTQGTNVVIHIGMEFCRFRDYEQNESLFEVRNCDCNGEICGKETKRFYMSKDQMQNYVLVKRDGMMHYIFEHHII